MVASRQTIANATLHLLRRDGIATLTLDRIAAAAGCAKGLINYHFGSKAKLLEGLVAHAGAAHDSLRVTALGQGVGTGALDALWEALGREVDSGEFGGWLDLVRTASRQRHAMAPADQGDPIVRAAAGALGLEEEDLAGAGGLIAAGLDGLQLQLLAGENPSRVREGFDRFWLSLLAE